MLEITKQGTEPFKYWVIKDPLHPTIAQRIFTELSLLSQDENYLASMYKYSNFFEKKLAQDQMRLMPDTVRGWLAWTLTSEFVDVIEKLTGITGLCVDPWFMGGGIHMHKAGGILRVHKDFTKHRKLGLIRRLNYIVYFNKNYEESWGGQLEFHSKDMSKCEVKIDPGYNVGVLFETPDSPHGFNTPWSAPDNIARKSLAVYLYTAPTKEDLEKEHLSTQFLKTPGEKTTPEIEELRAKRNKGRIE